MEIIKYTEIEPPAAASALFSIAWKDYIDTDTLKIVIRVLKNGY